MFFNDLFRYENPSLSLSTQDHSGTEHDHVLTIGLSHNDDDLQYEDVVEYTPLCNQLRNDETESNIYQSLLKKQNQTKDETIHQNDSCSAPIQTTHCKNFLKKSEDLLSESEKSEYVIPIEDRRLAITITKAMGNQRNEKPSVPKLLHNHEEMHYLTDELQHTDVAEYTPLCNQTRNNQTENNYQLLLKNQNQRYH